MAADLSLSWQQYIDDETGLPYLVNPMTGETHWIDVADARRDEQGNLIDDHNAVMNAWETHEDENGYPYYYNRVSVSIMCRISILII